MDRSATLEAVRQWPIKDRMELIFQIWDELPIDQLPDPSDELLVELDRRMEAHRANPADTRTWEDVLSRLKDAE